MAIDPVHMQMHFHYLSRNCKINPEIKTSSIKSIFISSNLVKRSTILKQWGCEINSRIIHIVLDL